jgi:hypothetical protein
MTALADLLHVSDQTGRRFRPDSSRLVFDERRLRSLTACSHRIRLMRNALSAGVKFKPG